MFVLPYMLCYLFIHRVKNIVNSNFNYSTKTTKHVIAEQPGKPLYIKKSCEEGQIADAISLLKIQREKLEIEDLKEDK